MAALDALAQGMGSIPGTSTLAHNHFLTTAPEGRLPSSELLGHQEFAWFISLKLIMPEVYRLFSQERIKSNRGMDCAVVFCFLELKSLVSGIPEDKTWLRCEESLFVSCGLMGNTNGDLWRRTDQDQTCVTLPPVLNTWSVPCERREV